MGNSKYLDSLNADEKKALHEKLWQIQNHKCFICGNEIDLDINTLNVDHIRPLANGGKDDPCNFAITHEHCNKSKQDADLDVAKRLSSDDFLFQSQHLPANRVHHSQKRMQALCSRFRVDDDRR